MKDESGLETLLRSLAASGGGRNCKSRWGCPGKLVDKKEVG